MENGGRSFNISFGNEFEAVGMSMLWWAGGVAQEVVG